MDEQYIVWWKENFASEPSENSISYNAWCEARRRFENPFCDCDEDTLYDPVEMIEHLNAVEELRQEDDISVDG